jgi:hypothetical protein
MLGEFLSAAKLRANTLLLAPLVQRRLMAMDFQPRRSPRIASQLCGLNSEQNAVCKLMHKLGLLPGDEPPSSEALEAYRRLFELPLMDDMIAAIGEVYGWSLSSIKGCAMPSPKMSGGRLMVA